MKDIYFNEKNKVDYHYVDKEGFKIKYELEKHANIVSMGQIVVSSTDKSIIGTTALDTCYGIVFYDRKCFLNYILFNDFWLEIWYTFYVNFNTLVLIKTW